MKIKTLINKFSNGVIGRLSQRDNTITQNGLKTCNNMLPLLQGGLKSRTGTKFAVGANYSGNVKLKSFPYTSNNSALVYFKDAEINFYDLTGNIGTDSTSAPSSSQIPDLRFSQNRDSLYMFHPDRKPEVCTGGSGSFASFNFEDGAWLDINKETNTTLTPSATSGTITLTASSTAGINNNTGFQTTDVGRLIRLNDRGVAYSITGVGLAAQGYITVKNADFKAGDLIYITDVGGTTQLNDRVTPKLILFVANYYTGSAYQYAKLYLGDERSGVSLDMSAYSAYTSGGKIQKKGVDTWHSILITSRSSTTVVAGTIQTTVENELLLKTPKNLSSTTPQYEWRLGAWSDSTGYPTKGLFLNQRLVLASTEAEPDRIWASRIGDFLNFTPVTLPDSSLNLLINNNDLNNIKWLSGNDFLRVGCDNAINMVAGDFSKAYKELAKGVADVEPLDMGNATVFVSKDKKSLKFLNYSGDSNRLDEYDLNLFNKDISSDGIKKISFQKHPESVIWVVTELGNLLSLTLDITNKIIAWSQHEIGGTTTVLDVEVVNHAGVDTVWLALRRTINSNTYTSLERISPDFEEGERLFLDSYKEFEDVSSCSGLSHLEGLNATVYADGQVLNGTFTVTSGSITLPATYQKVVVGLSYDREIETLPLSFSDGVNTILDTKGKVIDVRIGVVDSVGIKYGYESTNLSNKVFSTDIDGGEGIPTQTGSFKLNPIGGWRDSVKVYLKQDLPEPLTITSLTIKAEITE